MLCFWISSLLGSWGSGDDATGRISSSSCSSSAIGASARWGCPTIKISASARSGAAAWCPANSLVLPLEPPTCTQPRIRRMGDWLIGDLFWGRCFREWYQSIAREPARHAHLQRCLLGRTHLVTHDTFLEGRLHNLEWLLSRILRVTADLQCGASAVQILVEQAKAEITSGIGTKRDHLLPK